MENEKSWLIEKYGAKQGLARFLVWSHKMKRTRAALKRSREETEKAREKKSIKLVNDPGVTVTPGV